MPTPICEPIMAGVLVALINTFIINNHHLFDYCKGDNIETIIEVDDDTPSSSTSTTDAIEIHAHF